MMDHTNSDCQKGNGVFFGTSASLAENWRRMRSFDAEQEHEDEGRVRLVMDQLNDRGHNFSFKSVQHAKQARLNDAVKSLSDAVGTRLEKMGEVEADIVRLTKVLAAYKKLLALAGNTIRAVELGEADAIKALLWNPGLSKLRAEIESGGD